MNANFFRELPDYGGGSEEKGREKEAGRSRGARRRRALVVTRIHQSLARPPSACLEWDLRLLVARRGMDKVPRNSIYREEKKYGGIYPSIGCSDGIFIASEGSRAGRNFCLSNSFVPRRKGRGPRPVEEETEVLNLSARQYFTDHFMLESTPRRREINPLHYDLSYDSR